MYTTISISLLSLLFAYLADYTRDKRYLIISFIIIFLFLGLRYDFGNDLMRYLEKFEKIKFISLSQSIELENDKGEYGYTILNKLFSFGNFNMLLLFLAMINGIVYYKFITTYAKAGSYTLALFVYLFNTGIFLIDSSAIRQSIAILLFITALPLLIKKKYILYIIIIIIASFFHKSAFVLILFLFFPLLNKLNIKLLSLIYIILYIILLIYSEHLILFVKSNLVLINFSDFGASDYGDIYIKNNHDVKSLGFGTIFLTYFFAMFIYILNKVDNKAIFLLLNISILYFIIFPFSLSLPMINRISMYISPIMIVIYPLSAAFIKNIFFRYLYILSVVFYYLFNYYHFFNNPLWESFYEYNNYIFQSF